MVNERKSEGEIGVAFTSEGKHPFVPDDCIGSVWLGNINDRTGKRLYRGMLDPRLLPATNGGPIHVILFPFRSGNQHGISVQISKKHHGDKK